jgi:hypothetical protein
MIKGLTIYLDFIKYLTNTCLYFLGQVEIILNVKYFWCLNKLNGTTLNV